MVQTNNRIEKQSKLKLSIQIHLGGLSFCILDLDADKATDLKHIVFDKKLNPFEALSNLKAFLAKEQVLEKSFDEVTVVHVNELATLVAEPLFRKDALADYLKFNAKILKSDFIAYDSIKANKSFNVYVPYVNINNFIYDQFGSFTYKHFSTILIEKILGLENGSDQTNTYVHIGTDHFEIVVVEKSNLKLYNSFQYNSKEDFIYFILFTFEQLGLDPESHKIILLGDVSKNDELYEIAYKYIRHVEFLKSEEIRKSNTYKTSIHKDFIILNSF